jgi:NAD(P)-dependent dehydrogenase (short-subunit alcohol dehydrogenase family)
LKRVKGGTFGIGLVLVKALASRGAKLVLASRNAEQGAKVIDELEGGKARHVFVKTDVGQLDSVRGLMAATVKHFGGFDVLVSFVRTRLTNE